MADLVHLLDHDTRSDAPQFGEPVGTRTTRLTDTIFGWASLQLVHFSCKDEVL
jgi:hypothetical protein